MPNVFTFISLFLIVALSVVTIVLGVELQKSYQMDAAPTGEMITSPTELTQIKNYYVPSGYQLLAYNVNHINDDVSQLPMVTLDSAISQMPPGAVGFIFLVQDTSILTKTSVGTACYKNNFGFPAGDNNISIYRKTNANPAKYEYMANTDCFRNDRGSVDTYTLADAMTIASQYSSIKGFAFQPQTTPVTLSTQGQTFFKAAVEPLDRDFIRGYAFAPLSYTLPVENWQPVPTV